MTMRMMGVQGEVTGPVLSLDDARFTMDVEGEAFTAIVSCRPDQVATLKVGQTVFVIGRIHFREFDDGHLLIDAHRIHALDRRTLTGL